MGASLLRWQNKFGPLQQQRSFWKVL